MENYEYMNIFRILMFILYIKRNDVGVDICGALDNE
jgi:hypothetical protein